MSASHPIEFTTLLQKQRQFFNHRKTRPVAFRKKQLSKLLALLQANEKQLQKGVEKDLHKSPFDVYTSELALIYDDIKYYLKNLNRLTRSQKVKTNLPNLPGSSRVYPEPLGNAFIIGAWNYPYLLSISPLVAAIAAGNTVILKPSEVAAHSSAVMEELINNNFDKELMHVVEGDAEVATALLKLKFDKIFYTGSTRVGKIVYEAAAKNLTPVTLELGGKSPAFVTEKANLKVAAKRIVWGKFLNAGQTCVAPDYLLVQDKIKQPFINLLKDEIRERDYKATAPHYAKIINKKNFERLIQLIHKDKVIFGGGYDMDKMYIEPTLMNDISWEDPIMQEEIFGPILPLLSYRNFEEAIDEVASKEKPLSAYLFSKDKKEEQQFYQEVSFGGGCVNDVVMHLSNNNLPFGGVGNSGFGNYHGKYGFETFSHKKAVLKRATWGEPSLKYAPYNKKKLSWIKKLMG